METKFESRRKVITPKFRLDKNAFPELQDASLVCSDGVELGCHQCILCARVNYFRCMFSKKFSLFLSLLSTLQYVAKVLDASVKNFQVFFTKLAFLCSKLLVCIVLT